ncbi:MAG TPA: hypothetical protein VGB38_09210, partial [bacterium]
MKKILLFVIIAGCLVSGTARVKSVTILHEKAVPQAAYAARKLGEALAERDYEMTPERTGNGFCITLAVDGSRL